jgi:hypothetical protein
MVWPAPHRRSASVLASPIAPPGEVRYRRALDSARGT